MSPSASLSPSASPSLGGESGSASLSPSASPSAAGSGPSASVSPSESIGSASLSPSASPSQAPFKTFIPLKKKKITAAKPELSKNAPRLIEDTTDQSVLIGSYRVATWNTLGRPQKPKKGTIGFNRDTNQLEISDGKFWYSVSMD